MTPHGTISVPSDKVRRAATGNSHTQDPPHRAINAWNTFIKGDLHTHTHIHTYTHTLSCPPDHTQYHMGALIPGTRHVRKPLRNENRIPGCRIMDLNTQCSTQAQTYETINLSVNSLKRLNVSGGSWPGLLHIPPASTHMKASV